MIHMVVRGGSMPIEISENAHGAYIQYFFVRSVDANTDLERLAVALGDRVNDVAPEDVNSGSGLISTSFSRAEELAEFLEDKQVAYRDEACV